MAPQHRARHVLVAATGGDADDSFHIGEGRAETSLPMADGSTMVWERKEAFRERAQDGVEHLSFPYAFPRSGRYHIWVQVKRAGRVLTGAFLVDVA